MVSKNPYLSVVVCGRNDNHGGALLERTQVFLDCFFQQCEKHRIDSELIFVEWNPPENKAPLQQALRWPRSNEWCTARILQVPKEVHLKLRHATELPLFQMIAKNVGIRAAKGKFVLATNIDIIFSDSLMEFIREKRLISGNLYRVDRYDVPPEVLGTTLDERLHFCSKNILRINKMMGTLNCKTGEFTKVYSDNSVRYPDFLLEFLIVVQSAVIVGLKLKVRFARKRTQVPNRYYRVRDKLAILASLSKRLKIPLKVRMSKHSGEFKPFFDASKVVFNSIWGKLNSLFDFMNKALDSLGKTRNRFSKILSPMLMPLSNPMVHLYTNACGDFTLMSKDDWSRIRGYAEFEMFSLHIDSLLLYSAHYSGIKEVSLPDPIFHMDHSLGWSNGIRNTNQYFQDLDRKGVPYLTYNDFLTLVSRMNRSRKRGVFNGESWGLVNEPIREIDPMRNSVAPLASTQQLTGSIGSLA